ncbi:MAG: hypothetical protein KDA60_12655 [Planctomycetales bacterium]|nr:hypothetical protein [Planctomycetales bacterium]
MKNVTKTWYGILALFVPLSGLARPSCAQVKPVATVLAIQGSQFTVNDQPTFLIGASYYGGLGASTETIRQDLDDLHGLGVNWIRVWATWDSYGENVSALDKQGRPRDPYAGRLQGLVSECDRRGMIVDVTLARSRPAEGTPRSVHLPDIEAHQEAVRSVVSLLAEHHNWYLDLANERDVGDDRFVAVTELYALRSLARQLCPRLLVTASFGGHDLSDDDVRDAIQKVECDFLAVHRPRHRKTAVQTERETRKLETMLKKMEKVVPIHHQEPFRRGYAGWEPVAEDFVTDLRGAIAGGAAGWCFHNGSTRTSNDGQPRRSFDLRQTRLMKQLDGEELKVMQQIKTLLANGV